MKTILVIFLAFASILHAAPENPDAAYTALLRKYVSPAGVRYAAWKANGPDLQALEDYTRMIAQTDVATLSRNDQLAFYINAYNAWTLHNVLAAYPIGSIQDVYPLFGFFTRKTITVSGEKMSLNKLEHDIIIDRFKEPRIHAAINCASHSCPWLPNEVFTGAQLDAQLTTHFTNFVTKNPLALSVSQGGKSVALSSIFKWNEKDFQPHGGTLAYINQFRKKKLPSNIQITFQDYDWNLNEAK